jgi:hypothetical protein
MHKFYCDIKNSVADRAALDKALAEFLNKRHWYYGYNHSNATVNCLKKSTKNVHAKVALIYAAEKPSDEKHEVALATVQSIGFRSYMYSANNPDGDPTEAKWEFELGSKHKPLQKTDLVTSISSPNASSTGILGSVLTETGGKRSARYLPETISKKQQKVEEKQREQEAKEAKQQEAKQLLLQQRQEVAEGLRLEEENRLRLKEEEEKKKKKTRKPRVQKAILPPQTPNRASSMQMTNSQLSDESSV